MQIKARIKKIARERNITAQFALQIYMMERFLEQVSKSKYKNDFILKGGLLISSMLGVDKRTTINIDANFKHNYFDEKSIIKFVLKFIDNINLVDMGSEDKVIFTIKSINKIHETKNSISYRVSINSYLYKIVTSFKLDISSEDMIPNYEKYYKYR
jgi:hypothetical protein